MKRNFVVEGIISINCFKEDNQIDINIAITPENKFLELMNNHIENESAELFQKEILENLSLLFSLNLDDNKLLSKSAIDYVQLEVFSSYDEDYNLIFDSIISKDEIDYVKKYVYAFLIKREKESKLWDDYLA